MNCDIFIPIRLSSSRLPKKALLKIQNKPILQYLIERLKKSKKIRHIIVCTTSNSSDDELADYLTQQNFTFFRGNKKDILQRYLDAAQAFDTDFIINVDGDDIYTDPITTDYIVEEFERSKSPFIQLTGIPLGLTSFGFSIDALKQVCKLKKTSDTETGWIRFFTETNLLDPKKIKPKFHVSVPDDIRLSLDYPEDFELAKTIFLSLGNDFHLDELFTFINNNTRMIQKIMKTREDWKNHWDKKLSDISLNK